MPQPIESPITIANERMTIIDACNEIGMDIADFSIASLKTYCPNGSMHADEGRTKAFRIYPGTNSAWCFDCQQYFTPVGIIALDRGMTDIDAANWILERTNYVAPDYASRWEALVAPQEAALDTDALAGALKAWCARKVPRWDEVELEPGPVSEKLAQCLGLLKRIKTPESAAKWLDFSKKAMSQTIGDQT